MIDDREGVIVPNSFSCFTVKANGESMRTSLTTCGPRETGSGIQTLSFSSPAGMLETVPV